MIRPLDVATSFGATLARGLSGLRVGPLGPRPQQTLELYEFEACPYCRKVREALSALDLEADVRPCPKGGTRFRPRVVEMGGREQFPYLVDPNTGKALYESDAIVAYLYETYGRGSPPVLATGPLANLGSYAASALRPGMGGRARPSRPPEAPLELWSFEASPFCRIAREALCSLEIPYRLHNVAKGSPGRPALLERGGKIQVPYLADPNTGIEMYESADIVRYLESRYAQ